MRTSNYGFTEDDDLDYNPESQGDTIEWEDLPTELTPERELVLSVYKKGDCIDLVVGYEDIKQFITKEKQRNANKIKNITDKG